MKKNMFIKIKFEMNSLNKGFFDEFIEGAKVMLEPSKYSDGDMIPLAVEIVDVDTGEVLLDIKKE